MHSSCAADPRSDYHRQMHRFARVASALRSYRDADEEMSLLDIGIAMKQGRWPIGPAGGGLW